MNGKISNKIVLSGTAGSGKSTVGKLLAKKLNFPFLSMGDFSRQFAEEKFQLDINSFQKLCKTDSSLDLKIESEFLTECNSIENAVVDYRLGFHFIPNAFHVFLNVSELEAVRRIEMANRKNENASDVPKRNQQMRERFIQQYGLDFTDHKNYDLVIVTDHNSPEQICEMIIIRIH